MACHVALLLFGGLPGVVLVARSRRSRASAVHVVQPLQQRNVVIRHYEPADDPLLQALERRCIQGNDIQFYVHRSPEWAARAKQFPHHCIRVAADATSGEILGVTCGHVHEVLSHGQTIPVALNFDTRVAPEARGAGVGVLLTQDMARTLHQMGAAAVFAHLVHDNTASLRMFQRAGWKELPLCRVLCWPILWRRKPVPLPAGSVVTELTAAEAVAKWGTWFSDQVIPADFGALASAAGVRVWHSVHTASGNEASVAASTKGATQMVLVSVPWFPRLISRLCRFIFGRELLPLGTPVSTETIFAAYRGGPESAVLLQHVIAIASNECLAQGNTLALIYEDRPALELCRLAPHIPGFGSAERTMVYPGVDTRFASIWFHDPRG